VSSLPEEEEPVPSPPEEDDSEEPPLELLTEPELSPPDVLEELMTDEEDSSVTDEEEDVSVQFSVFIKLSMFENPLLTARSLAMPRTSSSVTLDGASLLPKIISFVTFLAVQ